MSKADSVQRMMSPVKDVHTQLSGHFSSDEAYLIFQLLLYIVPEARVVTVGQGFKSGARMEENRSRT